MAEQPSLHGLRILLVDQNGQAARAIKQKLSQLGATVFLAGDFHRAINVVRRESVQAVLFDLEGTEKDNFEDYQRLKESAESSLFYILSDNPDLDPKVLEVEACFTKPFDEQRFAESLSTQRKLHIPSSQSALEALDPLTSLLRPYLVFRSQAMRQSLHFVPQIAQSSHSALITGETGTGKEMVAMALHDLGPRKQGPFVAVNCGAIPESLIEGELFGHEKGAFTGAQALRKGKFELAQGGTLFLDELGEMPLALQARLLRVLEEKEFYRLGGEKPVKVDVRVVAATQVNLEKAVREGLFREDLYFRLNIFMIQLPALRDRAEDIPLLCWHFLERAFLEIERPKPYPSLAEETIHLLQKLYWSGNVRELRNLVTRMAVLLPLDILYVTPEILALYFPRGAELFAKNVVNPREELRVPPAPNQREEKENPAEVSASASEVASAGEEQDWNPAISSKMVTTPEREGILIPKGTTLKDAEELLIQDALETTSGNRSHAAKLLGIGVRTIRRRLNENK